MSQRPRRALTGAPIKLIAVVLFAVLIPSVIVTALGLVEVFQADSFVRKSFRGPVQERLDALGRVVATSWGRRMAAWDGYVRGTEDRLAWIARAAVADDSGVHAVLVQRAGALEIVDPASPRPLFAAIAAPALAAARRLEFEDRNLEGALREARRVAVSDVSDEIRLAALLVVARTSAEIGKLEDAVEALAQCYERFGDTRDRYASVRAVPLLVRRAELELRLGRGSDSVARVRAAVAALLRYHADYAPEDSAFYRNRLAGICPPQLVRSHVTDPLAALDAKTLSTAPLQSEAFGPDSFELRPGDLEELESLLRAAKGVPSEWRFVSIDHSRLGHVDVAYRDWDSSVDEVGDPPLLILLLHRESFAESARIQAEICGLTRDGVSLRTDTPKAEAFSVECPAPLGGHIVYEPPAGSMPRGFRGFDVVSLASYTWGIIVLVLAIVVGVMFALKSVLEELQTARLKTDFVSFVTHELKTPLTAIRMHTETVLDGRVRGPADARECLLMIDREAGRLTSLIDQILEYSKLERHQKKFQFTSCAMLDVVEEAVDIFHSHYQDKPRDVEINAAQHISKIRMDRAAMVELFLNLLSNAAKYSPDSTGIAINLHESIRDISVEVVDQGVGIRKRDQKKLFDRFYRADDYLTRDVDGTGLGLAFARYIAKVHNGDIKVSSQFGSGSSFTLLLRKTHILAE